jgi:hypothetical protein
MPRSTEIWYRSTVADHGPKPGLLRRSRQGIAEGVEKLRLKKLVPTVSAHY